MVAGGIEDGLRGRLRGRFARQRFRGLSFGYACMLACCCLRHGGRILATNLLWRTSLRSEKHNACNDGGSKGKTEDGLVARNEAERFRLLREARRQCFVAVDHGGDEVVFFVELIE